MHALPFTGQCSVFMNTGQIEAIAVTGRARCQRQVAFLTLTLTFKLIQDMRVPDVIAKSNGSACRAQTDGQTMHTHSQTDAKKNLVVYITT